MIPAVMLFGTLDIVLLSYVIYATVIWVLILNSLLHENKMYVPMSYKEYIFFEIN